MSTPARATATKPWWHLDKDKADLIYKVALAAGVGLFGHQFEQNLQTSRLLTQREQSDTQIRAEMFKSITDKLFRIDPNGRPDARQQAVFAQLLALNFNEHIELKPLLEKVKKDLIAASEQAGLSSPQRRAIDEELMSLRSVAKRVRDRQIVALVRVDRPDQPGLGERVGAWLARLLPAANATAAAPKDQQQGHFNLLGVSFPAELAAGADTNAHGQWRITDAASCDVPPGAGSNVEAKELHAEASPGGSDSIGISVTDADWERRQFRLQVNPMGPVGQALAADKRGAAGSHAYGREGLAIHVDEFDFPLTDNTLLASGARLAITLEGVCEREHKIKLGVLWFPPDYFPAHERPTNRRQMAEFLGLRQ